MRVHVHLTDREATLYVDTSGEPLFKRGYRRDADEAPLRENLAAGLLALAQWTPEQPLLDPMCGSGTIVDRGGADRCRIAHRDSRGRSVSRSSRGTTAPTWQRIRQAARDRIRAAPRAPSIVAQRHLPTARVGRTRSNLRTAQVDAFVRVERADVLTRAAPAPTGVLLANPPYGVRLADANELAAFYPRLGDALKQQLQPAGPRVSSPATCASPKLIGLKPDKRTPLWNGAIECRLFAFRIVAGSMRERGR